MSLFSIQPEQVVGASTTQPGAGCAPERVPLSHACGYTLRVVIDGREYVSHTAIEYERERPGFVRVDFSDFSPDTRLRGACVGNAPFRLQIAAIDNEQPIVAAADACGVLPNLYAATLLSGCFRVATVANSLDGAAAGYVTRLDETLYGRGAQAGVFLLPPPSGPGYVLGRFRLTLPLSTWARFNSRLLSQLPTAEQALAAKLARDDALAAGKLKPAINLDELLAPARVSAARASGARK